MLTKIYEVIDLQNGFVFSYYDDADTMQTLRNERYKFIDISITDNLKTGTDKEGNTHPIYKLALFDINDNNTQIGITFRGWYIEHMTKCESMTYYKDIIDNKFAL